MDGIMMERRMSTLVSAAAVDAAEALKDFEGTMLFVSHDRTFLRGLANRVLELDARPTTYGDRTWSTCSSAATRRPACTRKWSAGVPPDRVGQADIRKLPAA